MAIYTFGIFAVVGVPHPLYVYILSPSLDTVTSLDHFLFLANCSLIISTIPTLVIVSTVLRFGYFSSECYLRISCAVTCTRFWFQRYIAILADVLFHWIVPITCLFSHQRTTRIGDFRNTVCAKNIRANFCVI